MNNSTNTPGATPAPLIMRRLYKNEVARVLDYSRSEQLIDAGYIDDEVLVAGRWCNLDAYKRAHLLPIAAVSKIFEKAGVSWDYAYKVLRI